MVTITQSIIDDIRAQNATLYINDVIATDGLTCDVGDIIKLIVDDGLKFFRLEGYETSVYSVGAGYYYPISDDGKIAEQEYLSYWSDYNLLFFLIETRLAANTDNQGINDAYLVSEVQARQIIKDSFKVDQVDSNFVGDITIEPKDYSRYILGLIKLPFAIDPSLIIGQENIYLSDYDTGIIADSLSTDLIKLNLGSITIPSVKNNILDYKNTTALLHLPYVETITLDIDYVMGHVISIEYLINLYDSMATVNIYSSKLDGIIVTKSVNLSLSIPFGTLDTMPQSNDPRNVKIGADNGIRQPFIELLQNGAILEDGFFTIPIVDESVIGVNTGFMKVEEINLKSGATSYEKELIGDLLKQGVIIQ